MDLCVRYDTDGAVATITLNRPDVRNALTPEMLCRLADAFASYEADSALHALIITGAGEHAFCSGGDLGSTIPLLTGAKEPADEWDRRLLEDAAVMEIFGLRKRAGAKPVIAAVNGACMAGGFELLLGTDIRIAADHAQFALPEVSRGVLPFAGAIARLPRQVPQCIAMELMLTGSAIDASEAFRIGLVNQCIAAEQVMPKARSIARRISENAPVSVREIKRVAIAASGLTLAQAFRLEDLARKRVLATEDAKEGPRAFMEKRQPRFQGR
jgi:enoyl-CoA hydratase